MATSASIILILIGFILIGGIVFLLLYLMNATKEPRSILKMIYLYILSFVGIIITVVASIGIVDMVLKNYILSVEPSPYYYDMCSMEKPGTIDEKMESPTKEERAACIEEQSLKAKQEQSNQMKRDLSGQIAGLLIGIPLWLYHWGLIRKEKDIV